MTPRPRRYPRPRPQRCRAGRRCSWPADRERGGLQNARSGPGHPAGTDGDATLWPAAGQRGRAHAEVRPHVELDLLGQPQLVVQQGRQPVAGPGPGLDLEAQRVTVRPGPELDLARLEVPVQRREPERAFLAAYHPDGPVPRPRHADDELIALTQGIA